MLGKNTHVVIHFQGKRQRTHLFTAFYTKMSRVATEVFIQFNQVQFNEFLLTISLHFMFEKKKQPTISKNELAHVHALMHANT